MRLSQKADAVRKRAAALPRLAEDCMLAARKRDASAMVSYWRSGIAERRFRLAPLKPKTVAAKARAGYPDPQAPLYAAGLGDPRSYVRSLRKFRRKNGWSVMVPKSRHHKAKVTMDVLFRVHEYGATFVSKAGNPWRMPARPAFTKAYERVMTDARARDDNRDVRRACAELLREGRSATAARMRANADRLEAMLGA